MGRGAAGARGRARGCRARGRGGGAAGARGHPPLPTARPLASSVARSFGPKCSGCQRLTSPLPAGSGDRGRGHPQKGPERPPAPGLCPSSCTFSPPCPLEFSSFICCPRSSPFQGPICRPPPTSSFSVSTHPSTCLRPFSSFSCTRWTFSEVPGGAVERYRWASGAPSCPTWPSLASGLGEGGHSPQHLDSNQFTQRTFSLQCENNVKAHLKKNKQRIFSFFSYLLFTRYGCYKYNNGFTFHNGFS